MAAVITF